MEWRHVECAYRFYLEVLEMQAHSCKINESNPGIFRKENSAVQNNPINRFFSAPGSLSTAVPTEDNLLPVDRNARRLSQVAAAPKSA